MNEKEIKLAARLSAIEYMLAELFTKFYLAHGIAIEDVQKEHKAILESIRATKAPTDDPAISDLVHAEYEEAHEHLQSMIERSMKGRKTG